MTSFNTLISGNKSQTTTMPSWYDQAQQNIVSSGQAAASAMPKLEDTVAGQAINNLSGNANPFTQGQTLLSQIGTGAANPWITSASGKVTPNTATPLGGLFAAQNQQLQTEIPGITAPVDAASVAGGQFGSLRNQTAADTAITNASANLFANQMQAALNSQQQGINAASGLGNIGAQGTTSELGLGQAQQSAPLTSVADYANILGTIKAPTTLTQNYTAPLAGQIGALQNLANATGVSGILSALTGITGNAANILGNTTYGGSTTPGSPTDTSGSTYDTFPNILGDYSGDVNNTAVYIPTDTTQGPTWGSDPGTSADYTGGGWSG